MIDLKRNKKAALLYMLIFVSYFTGYLNFFRNSNFTKWHKWTVNQTNTIALYLLQASLLQVLLVQGSSVDSKVIGLKLQWHQLCFTFFLVS